MSTATRLHVRWMVRRDMPEVLKIDWESFITEHGEEWFLQTLRERNAIGMVVELDGEIVGWMVYLLEKNYIRLLSLAVSVNHRRQGVGAAMLEKLKTKLHQQRRDRIITRVHDANLGGHLWMKSNGFEAFKVEGEEYVFRYTI